ncbi:hypothetical protein APSETT444_003487 [Aspergillus pseudonomiae]
MAAKLQEETLKQSWVSGLLKVPLPPRKIVTTRKFVAQSLNAVFQNAAYYTPIFYIAAYSKTLGYMRSRNEDSDNDHLKSQDSLHVVESHILQERKIGTFGAISLVVNKIIGAGYVIFSVPLELVVVNLYKDIFNSSYYLQAQWKCRHGFSTLGYCGHDFYVWCDEVSASNAITSSSYLLLAGGVESTTWKLRGVAIAAAAFAVGLHTIAPRVGRGLQDLLSAVKLFTLLFIVCTGFAALAGHRRVPDPHNFDIHTSFKGTSNNGYNIGTALLDAIFSFQGYDNVNAISREQFAAVPTEEFTHSNITIAASLFRNVFGNSAATKALPALVAISAVGHLLGIAYTVPRVLQELAKDGITPFPNIMMQNRPFRTPVVALAVHLGVTILFICAPPAGDAFNFIVSLSSYPTTFLLACITVGLIKLRLTKDESWASSFSAPWVVIAFYLAGSIMPMA